MGIFRDRSRFVVLALALVAVVCVLLLVWFKPFSGPRVDLTPEEREWLTNNPDKLTLIYETGFPPIEFASERGEFIGFGADLIGQVEQRLDVRFTKRASKDWTQNLDEIRSGASAVAPTIVRTAEREEYAYFTAPYITVPIVIITSQAIQGEISFADLAGRRVAVVEGYATEKYVRSRAGGRFEVVPVKSISEGLRDVSFGRADALVDNLAVAAYHINKDSLPNLRVAGNTDYSFALSIAVSRKYPLLFSSVKKALEDIPAEELARTQRKWIVFEDTRRISSETLQLLEGGALFVVLLLCGLGIITVVLKRQLNLKVEKLRENELELRAQAERLRLSEGISSALFNQAYQCIGLLDLSGRLLRANASASELVREPMESLVGRSFAEIDWWPDPAVARRILDEGFELASKGEVFRNNEMLVKNASGETRMFDFTLSPLRDDAGKVTHFIVEGHDLTSLKSAQRALAESEIMLSAILNGSSDSIWAVDPKTFELLLCNAAFRAVLEGQGKTARIGMSISDALSDEQSIETWRAFYSRVVESGAFVTEWTQTETSRVVLLSFNKLYRDGTPFAISVFARDISNLKHAERRLRESEERYRTIVENAPMGIFRRTPTGEYDYVSNVTLRLFECDSLKEFIHNYGTIEQRWAHPDRHRDFIQRIMQDRQVTGYELETRLVSGATKWWSLHAFLEPESQYLNGFVVDITEQKRYELERQRLQEQLSQSQKMDAVGQLAGGVAHDFNNMLNAIMGSAELLRMEDVSKEESNAYIDLILNAGSKAAELTKKLLTFARKGRKEFQSVDVAQVVQDTIAILGRTIDRRIEISLVRKTTTTRVRGDASMLQNMFLNMGINASHAMPKGGSLTYSLQTRELDPAYCESSPFALTPGTFLEVEVRDTGCGMPVEVQKRVFEPFFTTKEPGKGTGLGLSAAYGAVQDHNGAIHVYSEVGVGTAFDVYLPVDESIQKLETKTVPMLIRGTGVILLVDDEDVVRSMATHMLESLGYEVRTASDGHEAVQIFEKCSDQIDLVILDMIMPKMNGAETFNRLRQINSRVKVILSSGFSKEDVVEEMKSRGLSGFIWKPFSQAELSQRIAEVLAQSSSLR